MTTPPDALPDRFRCLYVEPDDAGEPRATLTQRPLGDLPADPVTIRVRYSSLNYKDAMAARAHQGVIGRLPHVPGIDAAGTVLADDTGSLAPGSEVLVTGYELGTTHWGGWSEIIRVPAEWVVPLPAGLTLHEAMTLGTAGFTAAQCAGALEHHDILPESGPVAVSGASGGVGSLAVAILAHLGYEVTASTGKEAAQNLLKRLGAAQLVDRAELSDDSPRPLLSARWAGAVDTVGGQTLATLLRSTRHRGCVAACGLVGGAELPITVYPFILRGVTLAGIDSAQCPAAPRREIWQKLAGPWKPPGLSELATTVALAELPDHVEQILHGESLGRVVVDLAAGESR